MPKAPDSGDRSHDTDPLADTQTSDQTESNTPPGASGSGIKKRTVHVGDVLGRYELVEDVGEGGMATVYRARDRELRRDVAVKVLFPHLARKPEVVRRFHREARAAAGLEHPNILRVYDVGGGEEEDPPYIVMELIRGHSLLAEIERRGPMLAEVAACIGALLADALVVAHAAGIIHRDIKPANVLIAAGGRLLLADFGVARLETEDSLVTKTGSVLGTPAYMSPEQASGDVATAKSDLYSLGATMYQLSTGSLPYSGSPAKVIAQIASGQLTSAVRRRAEVGPDLSRVIDRLMALEPTARPENAAEVAAQLRAIATAGGLGDPKDELAPYFADPEAFVRDRTPKVVAAVVGAAKQAIADEKLPRAIALADRAAALAPEDPEVAALVHTVTEGGKASRRRRVLAMLAGAAVLAGGVTVGAMQLLGTEAAPDAAIVVAQADAITDSTLIATTHFDASVVGDALADANPDARPVTMPDAGPRLRTDAGTRPRDASTIAAVDARVPPPDATPMAMPPDAASASGFIVVRNDTWCDWSIDGVLRGQLKAAGAGKPQRVDAGQHTVVCEQGGTKNAWTKNVTVKAGETVQASGSMLGMFPVTVSVDATIDGIGYTPGTIVNLKRGRHELVIGGHKVYLDLSAACTVRSTPDPGCY